VLALYRGGQPVDSLEAGSDDAQVVLDRTPFYAESGGQVGDRGFLHRDGARFVVRDTQKIAGGAFGHLGNVESGSFHVGDEVVAEIEESRRRASMRNHSATHLLHRALRDVLGTHVAQKGSLVDESRTRFDFSHPQPVSSTEIAEIERRVNRAILANVPALATVVPYAQAIEEGAMALFGEKYGDEVRVLRMGDFSTELCGGTHVSRTGDIGLFKIISEGGVASGIRRIEAVTGENALAFLNALESKLKEAAALLRAGRDDITEKISQLIDRGKDLEKELAALKGKLAASAADDLAGRAREVKGVKVLAATVDGVDSNGLRALMDQVKNKLGSGIVLLGAAGDGKVSLIAGVTADLTSRMKAGELVNMAAQQVGGKGGGRPDMAQAGGSQPENLQKAVDSVVEWVAGKL
jgi:alanyl-tRNA synthetase